MTSLQIRLSSVDDRSQFFFLPRKKGWVSFWVMLYYLCVALIFSAGLLELIFIGILLFEVFR